MTKKIKKIIIPVVIIVAAFFGFKMFFANDDAGNTSLVAESSSTINFVDGQAILILLNKLNRITLDDSIFTNKLFTNLVSFERPIEDQIIGRKNPFLPIGVNNNLVSPRATSTATSTNR
jgi:hypothetical protein